MGYDSEEYGDEVYYEEDEMGEDEMSEMEINPEEDDGGLEFETKTTKTKGSRNYNPEALPADDQINSSVESIDRGDTSSLNDETPLNQNDKKGSKGGEFEMTDLKKGSKQESFVMKEFEIAGKVNQSAKKREKRKQKKAKELELKAILDERKRMQAEAALKEEYKKARAEGRELPKDNKLVKKILPKKTVVDEQGESWEVVD
jgi:hypothetical protein